MDEGTVPSGENPYGRTGAIAMVAHNGVTVKQHNPPSSGYGMGSFYWNTATASAMPFNSATASLSLQTNPTLFASSMSDFSAVAWKASSSKEDTVAHLENDVKEQLQMLEMADPEIDSLEYVSSYGVTPYGMSRTAYAFPLLQTIAPNAFEISQSDIATADHSFNSVQVGGVAVPKQNEIFPDAIAPSATVASIVLPMMHFYANTTNMVIDRQSHGDITQNCVLQSDQLELTCTNLVTDLTATDVTVTWYSEKEGESSGFTQDIKKMGEGFGVPFSAMRLLMLVGILGGMAGLVAYTGGNPFALVIFAG
ncbi:uncharacterized protein METZ01_LOCUS60735, partial [marine metagenome]